MHVYFMFDLCFYICILKLVSKYILVYVVTYCSGNIQAKLIYQLPGL